MDVVYDLAMVALAGLVFALLLLSVEGTLPTVPMRGR